MQNIALIALILGTGTFSKASLDYNGNPINRSGITITPQTSSAILASYTQVINTAGLLDNTFGSLGVATKNISGFVDGARAVAIQPDGKIVIVGQTNINGIVVAPLATPTGLFVTMRYNTNGTLDTSFGNGLGYVTYSFSGPGFVDGATGVALQSDGKIIVVGQTNIYSLAVAPAATGTGYFGILRYNPDGSLDTSFGPSGNGTVTKNFSGIGNTDGACGVTIQSDGKIVVVGGTNLNNTAPGTGSIALIRYLPTGYPDNAFGISGNGTITKNISGAAQVDAGYAVIVQPDGKILVAGGTNINQTNTLIGNFVLIRYNSDGSYDNPFGINNNGIVTTTTSLSATVPYIDNAYAVALQQDGKIIITGGANIDGAGVTKGYVATIRYNTDGTPDTDFGPNGNGIVLKNFSALLQADIAHGLAIQLDGKILIAGATNNQNHRAAPGYFFLIRYNIDGSYDLTFGPNNTGFVTKNISTHIDGAYGLALQQNGQIVLAGQTDITGGIGTIGNFATLRYINPFTPASFTASYGAVGMV